jgi:hypothetical protein
LLIDPREPREGVGEDVVAQDLVGRKHQSSGSDLIGKIAGREWREQNDGDR